MLFQIRFWFLMLSLATSGLAMADVAIQLPTGDFITPLAPRGAVQTYLNPMLPQYPGFVAGGAIIARMNPDHRILAVLCAGQNSLVKPDGTADKDNSTQYIFLYDVAGMHKSQPHLLKVIHQSNAYNGLVWSPDGKTLYASGGVDDVVYAYGPTGDLLARIGLNHPVLIPGKTRQPGFAGLGINVMPNAGGLAISPDGKTLVVTNNYNDSISVIDTATRQVKFQHDLRPYREYNEGVDGKAGGTYPFAVSLLEQPVARGQGQRRSVQSENRLIAYVSANRDREVDVIDITHAPGRLMTRIALDGNPLGMVQDHEGRKLYVAEDNTDQVAVIDTRTHQVIDRLDTRAPAGLLGDVHYTGASPIAVSLSPDGRTLYAVNDGANSVAVIPLRGRHAGRVEGLIPTAYAPKDIAFSAKGDWMYIINGKSPTGPNLGMVSGRTASLGSSQYPGGGILDSSGHPVAAVQATPPVVLACDAPCHHDNQQAAASSRAQNQYQMQLEKSSLVAAPVPVAGELARLTRQVASNDFYDRQSTPRDDQVMAFLHAHIRHILYVIKENRTYDQVLGDLGKGNGEPELAIFGRAVTPNFHRLAERFVDLDNFMDPGDGSMDGWSWATRGRITSTEGITQQINYAFVNRGLSYESEGNNRNVPVGLDVAGRDQATNGQYSKLANASLPGGANNLLPGPADHAATDSPVGPQRGYIFDAVLQAGLTVRNYGILSNNTGMICSSGKPPCPGHEISDPYASGVAQVVAINPRLVGLTDLYFREFDQNYPDLWRYQEWKREFDQYVAHGDLPNLELIRLSHDHMGSFATALAGVNTPETQQADDDLAVGKLVEAVAHSPYADSTLVIITEDDPQDGPDHVDSHRSTAYVVGPYVKKNAVVHEHYGQVNVLRTIEDILATGHLNLNTAHQPPMTAVFDIAARPDWSYDAVAATVLKTTALNLTGIVMATGTPLVPRHDAAYWASATSGFDFSKADQVPPQQFNRVLWQGLKSGTAFPAMHSVYGVKNRSDDDD